MTPERIALGVGIAIAIVGALWLSLVVLARRLPPGRLRDIAAFLPDCATTIRRLRRDPRVPTRVRWVVTLAGLYVLSPIDLIPEFLPVIGPLDDAVVIALALRYASRHIPHQALIEAWPGNPATLDRLLRRDGGPA